MVLLLWQIDTDLLNYVLTHLLTYLLTYLVTCLLACLLTYLCFPYAAFREATVETALNITFSLKILFTNYFGNQCNLLTVAISI